MGGASLVVAVLAALIYAALAVTALRNRLLARVAAREAFRRPSQSLLVVAGLTIATGAILGPQVWSDSSADSLIAAAYRSWGRVDITISAGGSYFSPEVAERLAADPSLRTSVAGVQAGVELVGSVSNPKQRLGGSAVRIFGFDPAAQPEFGAYVLGDGTPTFGEGLAPGAVVLSESLADSLQARPDDVVRVTIETRTVDFRVAGVARSQGPGVYGLRPALFAPLATVRSLTSTDLINVVRITARGDGQAEVEAARAAAREVRAVLATTAAGAAPGPALEVREVKAEEADAFDKQLEDNRVFTLALGLLVMAVGCALVINLVASLAEERRPRLAVLRALGLSRSGLIMLSMLEGALYSLAAAFLSLVTGIAIAWFMFAYSGDASLADVNGREIAIQPSVRPGTVAAAIAFGAVVTLLTMFGAAVRNSNMTISSAIKGLPEWEPARRRSWLRLAAIGALGLMGVLTAVAGDTPMRFVGGLALIVVASALARGRLPERTRATVTGVLVTAWGVLMLAETATSGDIAIALELYFLGTVTSVFGLSILIAANLRLLEAVGDMLGSASAVLRATLRPPLAYMTRRPLRAGLTIGGFGLVVAMVTSLTVAMTLIRPDYERDSGGFDVQVASGGSGPIALPASAQVQVARSISIPTRRYVGSQRAFRAGGALAIDWHQQLVPLFELSDAMSRNPLARLSNRNPRFSSDADVWRAVRSDPTWIISSWGGPGASLWLDGRDGPVELKVAGSFALGFLDGIAGSQQALAPFAELPAGITMLVEAQPGTDPDALALEIRRSLFAEGIDVSTTNALLDQGQIQGRAFLSIFRLLVIIGLVVGVLSLGVLSLRAVLERRRAIGILRALGYQPRHILAGVLTEATLTAALGIAVGIVAGLAATYFFFKAATSSSSVVLPDVDVAEAAPDLAMLFLAVVAIAVVASIGPAFRASRLAPVEALRVAD